MTLLTETDKLAHCEKRCSKMPFDWTVFGLRMRNKTEQHVKLVFLRQTSIFLSSLSRTGWAEVVRGGLLFSSTEKRRSCKSGRNGGVVFICAIAGGCVDPLWSPPTTRVLFSSRTPLFVHFFHHMLQHFPFSLSVSHFVCAQAAFHSSLCRSAACLWRTSFHCIRNWYLRARGASVRSGVYLCRRRWLWVSCLGSLPAVIWSNYRIKLPAALQFPVTKRTLDFPASGHAQWHENKWRLKSGLMMSFGLLLLHRSRKQAWRLSLFSQAELKHDCCGKAFVCSLEVMTEMWNGSDAFVYCKERQTASSRSDVKACRCDVMHTSVMFIFSCNSQQGIKEACFVCLRHRSSPVYCKCPLTSLLILETGLIFFICKVEKPFMISYIYMYNFWPVPGALLLLWVGTNSHGKGFVCLLEVMTEIQMVHMHLFTVKSESQLHIQQWWCVGRFQVAAL